MKVLTPAVPQEATRPASWWVNLIRAEYREMPDLHLTAVQMQQLWGLGSATCASVVDTLIAEKTLRRTLVGGYAAARTMN